jgi:predicted N-acyltransferase
MSATRLTVKTPPALYDPYQHRILHHCYLSTGFRPVRTISNHYIFITAANFRSTIRTSELRRLKKSVKHRFVAGRESTISPNDIVKFLRHCLDQNGYRLSLPERRLRTLLDAFPDDFLVFTVKEEGRLIAAAITVRVNHRVLYYYISGFLPEYRTFSPIVILMESIYEFCQQNHFKLFDLGPSLDHEGRHKPSLAKFKQNIGGVECAKITYELSL